MEARFDEASYHEIKNNEEKLLVVPADHRTSGVESKILFLEVNGTIEIVVLNLYPRQKNNSPYFSGEIGFFDFHGEFLDGYHVENGQLISQFTKSKSNSSVKSVSGGACQTHGECTSTTICIHCEQYLEEVELVYRPPSEPETIYVLMLYPSYEGTGGEEPSIDYTMGTGGGGGGGTTTPALFNIVIDPSINEYPCLAEVLNVVLNTDSDLFRKTIAQFIENPKYDLTFTVGECNSTENMCTNGNNVDTTGEIRIKIEDTYQNPISFAAGILHEGIHAEIFRFVNEHHEGIVDPNDMPQLFEYFQLYAGTAYEDDIDHIYMTQYYIVPIAEALMKMDGFQYPLNYYKPFAWDGLRAYDPNNSLGITDEEYSQYRNEVTSNFSIKCNE